MDGPLPPDGIVLSGSGTVVTGALGGPARQKEAQRDEQNLADEDEEEAAGHAPQHARQQSNSSVEAEDAEQTLDQAAQPVRKARVKHEVQS